MTLNKYLMGGILWALLLVQVGAEEKRSTVATNRIQINETITNGFRHPGIGLTKEMLDTARELVIAKREPWYTGFNRLAADSHAAKEISCRNQSKEAPSKPDDDAFNSRSTLRRLQGDCDKAYKQALMYYLTGDLVYRANAMNIIRVWSQMDPNKYDSFDASHIHAPYAVKELVMAAELMRYTECSDRTLAWTDQDTANLKKNIIDPSVETFMYSNGWFMNQSGFPCAGAMACFIFLDDREGYNKRVEWFTINKTAPNKGWAYSIQDIFRKVEVNAQTGERVAEPVIQLMEMGRDHAHSAGDLEIAKRMVRLMHAQATKVDPVQGTASTSRNAVGPYEFLDNRILKAADHQCRFMLGYDTPWIPSPSDIDPNGKINQIYYRISDNYRGRIRDLSFWDLYYYYTYEKGIEVAEVAPYYYEAFKKRVVTSTTEWLFIPSQTSGEGARLPQTEQEPEVVEIVERSTVFGNASILEEEGNSFLRVNPSPAGKRIALLSIKTPSKTIGLRIRTTGIAALKIQGLKNPWLLPNTQGEWRHVTHTIKDTEFVEDIIFVDVIAYSETTVDLDHFLRMPEKQLNLIAFHGGNKPRRIHTYVGAPLSLDYLAGGSESITYSSLDKPEGSVLDVKTGAFRWTPRSVGKHLFVVEAFDGKTIAPIWCWITVAKDRVAAMEAIKSDYDPNITYVKQTLDNSIELYAKVGRTVTSASDSVFVQSLIQLQQAFDDLEVLTPLLPDGSVDFPKIVQTSDIDDSIGLLTDSNDDTFPQYYLAKDMDYIFDFGSDFQLSFTRFEIEGRMNFDDRTEGTVFYGSNDQQDWTELTKSTERSTELVEVNVSKSKQEKRFRYLRIKKHGRGLFEPSEMRIYGTRYEAE